MSIPEGYHTRSFFVDSKEYIQRLGETFPILFLGLIYYPGCGTDFISLEDTFSKNRIVYLDNDEFVFRGENGKNRKVVIADAEKPPFRKRVFDAVLMKNMHPSRKALTATLQTLRPGGLLIFSQRFSIWREMVSFDTLRRDRRLRELPLPFATEKLDYVAFQKITKT
ncbi:methyltransferase domain-containing protein [Candidatus Daviesbacteria bacterium]|nr:methyltransferase domain-containing protein [Candidatus Daviesbacteria bacterium]